MHSRNLCRYHGTGLNSGILPETDPYNPPSPVPAMVSVISAAFAIAIFGFPLNAPYDISPRYTGTDSFMPASRFP